LLVVLAAAFVACDPETDDDPTTASNAGGAGGASAQTGAGGDGGEGGRARSCVGCGEYTTTSEPAPMLCEVASLDLYLALDECLCASCEAECGVRCMLGPSPPCSTCKVKASHGVCAEEFDACSKDI
jgi:hypothetical protein